MQASHHDETSFDSCAFVDSTLRDEILVRLKTHPKSLPAKLLYDATGSQLFDRICELEEYYPTRTEVSILERHADEMVGLFGPACRLVELGSGSSQKTGILLDRATDLAGYVPIDISKEHLETAARRLRAGYPKLRIEPMWADYTKPVGELPDVGDHQRTVVFFPGSTIGNFSRRETVTFLSRLAALCRDGGGLLIGVDLVKDEGVLCRAYNDREGITAKFNLNMLAHINAAVGAHFDLAKFRHRAIWDPAWTRIEMQLVSRCVQTVRIGTAQIPFGAGEVITTEFSRKYTLDGFAALAGETGFAVQHVWTDPGALFSLQYLVPQ